MAEYLFRSVDLETSSDKAPPEGEVIEFGFTDVRFDPETLEVSVGTPISVLFKPTRPLAPDNIAIHHLTMADLDRRPVCTDADLRGLVTTPMPFAVAAHNIAFEQQFLTPEIMEGVYPICTMKCAIRLWPDAPDYKNQTLRYWLGLDLPAEHAMPPHRGGPDSFVTAHILARMLTEAKVNDLVKWSKQPRHYPVCPLKKHKGQKWGEIPHDYLVWILRAPEMESDIKAAAQAEIDYRRQTRT